MRWCSGLSKFLYVPQAPKHLCPAKLQTRCAVCCACQSVCVFISFSSGMAKAVGPQTSLKPKTVLGKVTDMTQPGKAGTDHGPWVSCSPDGHHTIRPEGQSNWGRPRWVNLLIHSNWSRQQGSSTNKILMSNRWCKRGSTSSQHWPFKQCHNFPIICVLMLKTLNRWTLDCKMCLDMVDLLRC